MKSVANDEEPAVLIPAIVDPVPVQVQAVLVGIHVRHVPVLVLIHDGAATLYSTPSTPLPIEYSLGCISFGSIDSASTLYQVSSLA